MPGAGSGAATESDFTTALDGTEQDVFGSVATPAVPPGITGVVRLYPDLVNMGAADTVEIKVYRRNDGATLRLVDTVTYTGAQANDAPMLEVRFTRTRGLRVTVERTAGTVTVLPIGIEEASD